MNQQPSSVLTLLFDGGCPLCVREVNFLRRRDRNQRLRFVDINAADYNPAEHADISYRQAMGRIHAIRGTGEILRDVAVFREAYRLLGLGWVYAPTAWPMVAPFTNGLYRVWADWRLRLTGRPALEVLCQDRCAVPQSVMPAMADVDTSV